MINRSKKYKKLVEERDRLKTEVDKFYSQCDCLIGTHVLKLKKTELGKYSEWVNDYITLKSELRHLEKTHPKRRKKHLVEAIYEVLKSDLGLEGGTDIYIKENHKNGDIHIVSGSKPIGIRIKMTLDNRPWETEMKASRSRSKNYFLMVRKNDTTGYVKSEMERTLGKWTYVYMDKPGRNGSGDNLVMEDWVDQLVGTLREILGK